MSKEFPITISSWTLGDQCKFEDRVIAAKNAGYGEVKELIVTLQAQYPDLKSKVFGAMQRLPLPKWGPEEK